MHRPNVSESHQRQHCGLSTPPERRRELLAAAGAALPHNESGVAVVKAGFVVVGGHQQRLAGVVAVGTAGHVQLGREPPLRELGPVAHASWAGSVRAQQTVLLGGGERGVDVTCAGGGDCCALVAGDGGLDGGKCVGRDSRVVGELVELDAVGVAVAQQLQRALGVAGADECGELCDGTAGVEAVDCAQQPDRFGQPCPGCVGPRLGREVLDDALEVGPELVGHGSDVGGVDQIAKDCAGFDGCELVGVADEYEPGRGR